MAASLTSFQNIALSLVFDVMGESRYNRSYQEYMEIAARLPPLKELTYRVNERLTEFLKSRGERPEICRFKAGDQRVVYEPYPDTISYETVRAALNISGMRQERGRRSSKPL